MNERSTISASISVFVGEVSPVYFSLNLRLPREFSLGFGTIKASLWRCRKSFPPSPTFQSSLWKSVLPVSSLSGSVPSSFGHCSGLLPGVSPVFDCTETILGEIFSTFASLPELSLEARPPGEFSLGFDTIKASFWPCIKLLPEVSPIFDRTETTLRDFFSTFASLPEFSLEQRPPREFSLGFGTIKAYFWRCSGLLPGVSPVFDRTEATLGEVFPPYASLPEVSLEILPPRKFSLGFSTIKASFWRCSDLPPVVSPVFDRTETILGDIFPTYASLPEVSLEVRPPP